MVPVGAGIKHILPTDEGAEPVIKMIYQFKFEMHTLTTPVQTHL